ncbi:type IV-A pilus assembly ATPase PilB, partial [bacterium]|nr:type IV-A pilus assembly ATPase PilB [bacterium]
TKPEKLLIEQCGVTEEELMKQTFYGPKGCPECKQMGFKGRIGCYEVMDCTPTLRQMIYDKASSMELLAQAIKEGMKTLVMAGKEKAFEGVTSVSEASDLSSN